MPGRQNAVPRYSISHLMIATAAVAVILTIGVYLGYGAAGHGIIYLLLCVAIRRISLKLRCIVALIALSIGTLVLLVTIFDGYPKYQLGIVYYYASVSVEIGGMLLFPISGWMVFPGEGLVTIRPVAVIFSWLGLGAAFGVSALFTIVSARRRRSNPNGEVDRAQPRMPAPEIQRNRKGDITDIDDDTVEQ